jgi:hypothetical protein
MPLHAANLDIGDVMYIGIASVVGECFGVVTVVGGGRFLCPRW